MARLRAGIQFTRPSVHILRGLGFFGSTHLGFYAIAHLELVTVTVLFFTAPIFAAVLSALFAGERIGPRRVAAILAGFCGVLVVLRPDTGAIDLATFAAIGSSLMFAATLILSRQLSDADGSMSVLFSSVGLTAILSVPLAVPVAEMPGSMIVWSMIGILIAAGAVRSFADIRAYSVGDAAVIAPIIYIRLNPGSGPPAISFSTRFRTRRPLLARRSSSAPRSSSPIGRLPPDGGRSEPDQNRKFDCNVRMPSARCGPGVSRSRNSCGPTVGTVACNPTTGTKSPIVTKPRSSARSTSSGYSA